MPAVKSPARPTGMCRTPQDCWDAGWRDGADDPPMTSQQIAKLALLWRLHLRRPDEAA
jgi:hypothetical protein